MSVTSQVECPGDGNPILTQVDESTELKEVNHVNFSSDSNVHGIRSDQINEESVEPKTGHVCKPKDLSLDNNITMDIRKSIQEIAIGCGIKSAEPQSRIGTVGPLIRIKETGELGFLTARHIFGPPELYFYDKKLTGTSVFLCPNRTKSSTGSGQFCGTVIAEEYNEKLDVAIIKLCDENMLTVGRFAVVKDEQLQKAGFGAGEYPVYSSNNMMLDARKLTQNDMSLYRLVKFGSATGFTTGKLSINESKGNVDDFLIRKDESRVNRIKFLDYKQQLCVTANENEVFAKAEDDGAAVFLVDTNDHMHCIGMICHLLTNKKDVIVTPIQEILESLGNKMGKTLELATFEDGSYQFGNTYEIQRFIRALSEGQEIDRQIRINIVGFYNEGKTSLTKRLLDDPTNNIESTDGIEVHIRKCRMQETGDWIACESNDSQVDLIKRFVHVVKTTPVSDIMSRDFAEIEVNSLEDSENVAKNEGDQAGQKVDDDGLDSPEVVYRRKPNRQMQTPGTSDSSDKITRPHTIFWNRVSECINSDDKTVSNTDLVANIWDFGGQFIYYATHQIFHSRDAIYLLVFDLNKRLGEDVIDVDFPKPEKMENNLKFWVNSIHAFVGSQDGSSPKIILVGTHKDKFKGSEQEMNAKFEEIKNLFCTSDAGKHIYARNFAIANLDMSDTTIRDLRNTIFELAVQNVRGKHIPAKWIPLEIALLNSKNKKILLFKEVVQIDSESDDPIAKEEDIKLFLKYHHEKGTLVYFNEEVLSQYVIVDPQYLIDAFKCIITSKESCRKCIELHQKLKNDLATVGVVEKNFIEEIWKTNEHADFTPNKDILLKFLQRHRIIAELQEINEHTGELFGVGKYLIPCLLQKQRQDAIIKCFLEGKYYTGSILGLSLKHKVVQSNIYERLTAAALGRWSPIIFEGETLVYRDVGYYKLDAMHAGRIEMKPEVGIELTVIYLCPPNQPHPVECDRFRRYVEQVIKYEFRKLQGEEREECFSYYIKCNSQDHCGSGSKNLFEMKDIKPADDHVCCPDYKNHVINVRQTYSEWFLNHEYRAIPENPETKLNEIEKRTIAKALGSYWNAIEADKGTSTEDKELIFNFLQRNSIAVTKREADAESGRSTMQNICHKNKVQEFLDGKISTITVLGLALKNKNVIRKVYQKLTSAVVDRWKPIEFENVPLRDDTVGFYQLDLRHAGKIELKENGIELIVISLCPQFQPSPVECDRFRSVVEQTVEEHLHNFDKERQDQPYFYYIKCNHQSHGCLGSNRIYNLESIKDKHVCCPEFKNHTIDVLLAKAEWFINVDDPLAQIPPNRQLKPKELQSIASAIGSNWPLLGARLGLTTVQVSQIKMDHAQCGTSTVIYYMLEAWKTMFPEKANMRYLIQKIFHCEKLEVDKDKIRNVYDDF